MEPHVEWHVPGDRDDGHDMEREFTGHDTTPSAVPAHRRSTRNTGARAVVVILAVSLALLVLTWLLGGFA